MRTIQSTGEPWSQPQYMILTPPFGVVKRRVLMIHRQAGKSRLPDKGILF